MPLGLSFVKVCLLYKIMDEFLHITFHISAFNILLMNIVAIGEEKKIIIYILIYENVFFFKISR